MYLLAQIFRTFCIVSCWFFLAAYKGDYSQLGYLLWSKLFADNSFDINITSLNLNIPTTICKYTLSWGCWHQNLCNLVAWCMQEFILIITYFSNSRTLRHVIQLHCTEVRFASFLSCRFTTIAVMNPPEKETGKTHICALWNCCIFNKLDVKCQTWQYWWSN